MNDLPVTQALSRTDPIKPLRPILLVAHAPLASAWMHVLSHTFGAGSPLLHQIGVIDVPADANMTALHLEISAQLQPNMLILSDLYGASPHNAVVSALQSQPDLSNVFLSGVSMATVIRAVTHRHLDDVALCEKLGQNTVMQI